MKKSLIVSLPVAAFVAGMAIVPNTFAAPADCNAVKSSEFADAITTCDGNIKLGESITASKLSKIDFNLTIDLNGFNISYSSNFGLWPTGNGNLILKNTGQGGGEISLSSAGKTPLFISGHASATVGSGVTIKASDNIDAVQLQNGGKLYATGNAAFISDTGVGILNDSSTVDIKDQAKVTSNDTAILAQGTNAVVNISGGTVSGSQFALAGTPSELDSPTSDTQFNITGGEIISSNGVGITVLGENPKVTMSGGSVHAKSFALSGNGLKTTNSNIEISGSASLTSDDTAAIYNPQSGSLKVTGGTLSGAFGIVARQGEVSVTGGTIKASGTGNRAVGDSDVELPVGVAILTDNTENYGGGENPASVTISGPVVIESSNQNPVLAYGNTENDGNEISIGAGVDFVNQEVDSVYVQTGLVQGPNGVIMTEAEAEEMEAELNRKEESVDNPNTADPIALYVTVAVLALLGLGATAFLAKKSNR